MRDSGDPSFSDTAEVTIQIKDYNDNPPVFSPVGYGTKVREDIVPGKYLMSVTARDSDTGTNKDFKYSIFEGNPDGQFRIDDDGHVYVNQRLDRETQESYLLTIRATNIGRNRVKIGAKSFLVHKRFWGQNEVWFAPSSAKMYLLNKTSKLRALCHPRLRVKLNPIRK